MNQTQRSFLIKKIEAGVESTIKMLRDSKPEGPSLNKWLLHYVLSDKFEINSIEHIKGLIKKMALKAGDRDDWMGNSWGSGNKKGIHFEAKDIFVMPPEYQELAEAYLIETNAINDKIYQLQIQADTLITRIQLASDKTLDKMITEVDDMGDISLIDTKLKLLSSGNDSKLLA